MSEQASSAAPPTPAPLRGAALIAAAILTALANFIAVLDLTIANVSVPTIAAALGVSPREGSWVITSYAVAEAIVVPLTGWLAQRFGPARVMVWSMAAFGITSALCAMSTSIQGLVIFRVMQGLAGGPMVPISQALMLSIYPKEKQGMGMALWAMTAVLGPICGPLIGGTICEHWSWHWLFLINLPIALVGTFLLARLLAGRDPPPQRRPVDVVGLALMVSWIGAVQLILDRGRELDWFGSPFIVTMAIVAVIGFIAFLIWELTDDNPIVNLRIFRDRSYSVIVAVICVGFGAFFGTVIVQPLWLQSNMGYTPQWAGFAASPQGMAVFVLAPLISAISGKVDNRALASFGLLAFGCALLWRAHFASNVTFEMIVASQLLNGMCLGFFFAPVMTVAFATLKPQDIPAAAGILSFMRTTAVAFSAAITTTAWHEGAARNRIGLIDRFDGQAALEQMDALGLPHDQALRVLDNVVEGQAVMMATNDAYFIFAFAMMLGGLLVWLAPKATAGPASTAH